MQSSNAELLSPEELERRVVKPFVDQHFPFMSQDVRPQVTLVRPGRALIARRAAARPLSLPAQYSYIYVYEGSNFRQVVYVLADVQGNVLRSITSK